MNWGGVGGFLHMGGYGLYVWGSFGMCALVLLMEWAGLAARRRALRAMPPEPLDERPLHEA
jgi:heme exporter protein D